jgi:hypothetical protein
MTGGHGHVKPRPDGGKARCGGPAICKACQEELGRLKEDREASKNDIAADVERKIGTAVSDWFESGEFDLHARVRGIVRQGLSDFEAALK